MTFPWQFSYDFFVKLHDKKKERNNQIWVITRYAIKGLYTDQDSHCFINPHFSYKSIVKN